MGEGGPIGGRAGGGACRVRRADVEVGFEDLEEAPSEDLEADFVVFD